MKNPCEHGHASSHTWPLTDIYGIPLTMPLVCESCCEYWWEEAKKKYRLDILTGGSKPCCDECEDNQKGDGQ